MGAAAIISVVLSFGPATGSTTEILQEVQGLIQKGDLAGARAQLAQVLKISPQHPTALNLLGVIEAREGHYRAAEASFQKAIGTAPDFGAAYLNLGRLYQENSSRDSDALKKAVATYERLLKFEPTNIEANYQSAFLLSRLGSFQASLRRLSRLPRPARERPQALAVRLADDAGLKEHVQAEATADRLLKHPDLVEADILRILPALLAQHDEDLALKLLEGLGERRMASPDSLEQLASLYEHAGGLDRARATLEAAVELRQSVSVALLLKLAHLANQQGDHEGALGYLAHARDLDPNNGAIHFFFGMVCVEMNLAEEAYQSLKKAVRFTPANPYYNYALGAVIMDRDVVREAYPYFRKYCELKPDDPRGHLALGAAYFYGHDIELARQELEGVMKHPATAASAHYFLGRIAKQEGKFTEARQEILKALEDNPRYPDAYTELGLLHFRQKEYKEAEQAFEKALALHPDSYNANLNLLVLYQRTQDPRADAQAKRFEEIKKERAERQKEFFRTIEVRP